jgi:hypothetical protein
MLESDGRDGSADVGICRTGDFTTIIPGRLASLQYKYYYKEHNTPPLLSGGSDDTSHKPCIVRICMLQPVPALY